nr:GH32 C-terminal domain-containing protein [Bacteroidota bacterium]
KVFKHGEEETLIYFDAADEMVKIDRTHSGDTSFNKKFSSIDSVSIPRGIDDLKFRILIDNSIVEVFINDGEYALTDLIFPRKTNGTVQFFATDLKGIQFRNLKIWEMNAPGK